jgi:hypothetical protein
MPGKRWWFGKPPKATDDEIATAVGSGLVVPVFVWKSGSPTDTKGVPVKPIIRLVRKENLPLATSWDWARVDVDLWLEKRTELGLIVVRHPNPERGRFMFHVGWNPALRDILGRLKRAA